MGDFGRLVNLNNSGGWDTNNKTYIRLVYQMKLKMGQIVGRLREGK